LLVRYKTGDLVEVHETDDESGPLISILGRKDHDMVRAGGFEIKKDSIEKSLLSINHLVSNNFILTVHETYKNQKPFLTFSLQIELKEKDENKHAEIMKFIEDHLVATLRFSTTMSFKQAQEQGFFGDITITSTTFPEQAKSAQQIILEQIYEE
jgi:phenylacetate-coenzyme A ligase PaaK-like adenylate-forming protein